MDKVRISEVAQELGIETKEVLAKAKELTLPAKAANRFFSVCDPFNSITTLPWQET